MTSRQTLVSFFAFMLFVPVLSKAQETPGVQLWLTTADRSALFSPKRGLHFSDSGNQLPTVEVNDMQQFQKIEGFGFALTGGSAQLLMRMTPERRTALLKDIFSTEGDGIGVSYLRVSIGSSDMNDHVFSYEICQRGRRTPILPGSAWLRTARM